MKRWALAAAVAVVCVPLVVRGADARTGATAALLLLAAAMGLNLAMGFAGQPSLGQGLFVGAGAYAVAVLRAHAGWGPVTSTLAAIGVCAMLGAIVARAVAFLRPAFVALVTWVLAWA